MESEGEAETGGPAVQPPSGVNAASAEAIVFDLKILMMTPGALLNPKNAY